MTTTSSPAGPGAPRVVGIVTARGESKGLPRKNLLPLAGKPMLAWTIEAARGSGRLARVILSTDDPELAAVGADWGAEVPFLRPAELAQDDSPHVPVVLHAMRSLDQARDEPADYIMLLQPTSPLRMAEDIVAAIDLAVERGVDAVVSVSEVATHPYLTYKAAADGRLESFCASPNTDVRRQAFPPLVALNGAIYLVRRTVFLQEQTLMPSSAIGYVMPRERALDVNDAWDMHLADLILSERSKHAVN